MLMHIGSICGVKSYVEFRKGFMGKPLRLIFDLFHCYPYGVIKSYFAVPFLIIALLFFDIFLIEINFL